MSVRALRSTFGPLCHWCGLPMAFDEPHGRPQFGEGDAPVALHQVEGVAVPLRLLQQLGEVRWTSGEDPARLAEYLPVDDLRSPGPKI